ncbi:MAG: hypothetical protein RLZZ423_1017 [Cyanobacteriota bacterium]
MALPRFLAVRVGDLVAVDGKVDGQVGSQEGGDWWLGQVIHAEGGARCNANSLFQIACVDSGVIRTVNADAVIEILSSPQPADAAASAAFEPAHDHGHQGQGTGQGYQQGDRHGR